jgi:hypothetical protein
MEFAKPLKVNASFDQESGTYTIKSKIGGKNNGEDFDMNIVDDAPF